MVVKPNIPFMVLVLLQMNAGMFTVQDAASELMEMIKLKKMLLIRGIGGYKWNLNHALFVEVINIGAK